MNKGTDLYTDEDYERWFIFIEQNIYDLPYYKKNKWRFSPNDIILLRYNKEWIYRTYEKLSIFYAEKATNIIIDYVNRTFQDGSLNIVRETLDFIVSLFGENIVEEFVDKDFSIEHLEKIIMEELNSERYEGVAYLICKEPKLNLAENTRVTYKWKLSNSLESKKINLALFDFADPMGFGPLRQLEMKEIFKGATEQTRREITEYEKNMKKDWNICLANERLSTWEEWIKDRKKCIPIPYIKKDISYEDLSDIKSKIQSIHQEIALLLDRKSPLKKEEMQKQIHVIYEKYDLQKYILAENKKKPTLKELKSYASALKIKPDKFTQSSEIAFLILIKSLFPNLEKEFEDRKKIFDFDNIGNYISFFMNIYFMVSARSRGANPDVKIPDIYNRGEDRIQISNFKKAESAAYQRLFQKYFM